MSNQNEQIGGTDPEAETPTTATGTVTRIPRDEISYCMDGAKYLLHYAASDGVGETLRLRPTDDGAERVLDRASGTGDEVTVTGYIRHVECTRLDVFRAQRARQHEPAS
jgi:hypothetical protein